MFLLTSLRWTLISAWRWCARTIALRLLDTDRTAVQVVALELVDDHIGILRRHHIDEAKATGFSAVWVADNGGILDFTMLREEVAQLFISERADEARDEQICACVPLLYRTTTAVIWRCTVEGQMLHRTTVSCEEVNVLRLANAAIRRGRAIAVAA